MTTQAPADPIGAIRAFLLLNAAIVAIAETRVYGDELNRNENASMPQGAVLLTLAGGGLLGRSGQRWKDTRVDVITYGATMKEAADLGAAAELALDHLVTYTADDGTEIKWARPSARSRTDRDPVTQWPRAISTWQVLHSSTVDTP